MIKIEIRPSFIASSCLSFEQRNGKWVFIFYKNEFNYKNEVAAEWIIDIDNNHEIKVIYELVNRIITDAKIDDGFCIDGVCVVCYISEGEVIRSHGFASARSDTTETAYEDGIGICSKIYCG